MSDEPMSYEDAAHPLVNHMGKADDELLALARKAAADRFDGAAYDEYMQAARDPAAIIAMHERHRAEVERLEAALTERNNDCAEHAAECGRLGTLVNQKHAEVERLTRERDEAHRQYLELAERLHAQATAAESALAAAQKRVREVEAAGDSLTALITQTQERLTAWLCPDGAHDERECMNELLEMFDGPRQREIQSAWRKATGAK